MSRRSRWWRCWPPHRERRDSLPGCQLFRVDGGEAILARVTELRPEQIHLRTALPLLADTVVFVQTSEPSLHPMTPVPARVESCVAEDVCQYRVKAQFLPRLTTDEFHALLFA